MENYESQSPLTQHIKLKEYQEITIDAVFLYSIFPNGAISEPSKKIVRTFLDKVDKEVPKRNRSPGFNFYIKNLETRILNGEAPEKFEFH